MINKYLDRLDIPLMIEYKIVKLAKIYERSPENENINRFNNLDIND